MATPIRQLTAANKKLTILHVNLEALEGNRAGSLHRFACAAVKGTAMKRAFNDVSFELTFSQRSGPVCAVVSSGKKFVTDTVYRYRCAVFECDAAHAATGQFVGTTGFD